MCSARSSGLTAIFLEDRTVPVLDIYAERLRALCRAIPSAR